MGKRYLKKESKNGVFLHSVSKPNFCISWRIVENIVLAYSHCSACSIMLTQVQIEGPFTCMGDRSYCIKVMRARRVILLTVFKLSPSESPTSRDRAWSASSNGPQRALLPLPCFPLLSLCVDSWSVFLAIFLTRLFILWFVCVSLSVCLAHLHLRLVFSECLNLNCLSPQDCPSSWLLCCLSLSIISVFLCPLTLAFSRISFSEEECPPIPLHHDPAVRKHVSGVERGPQSRTTQGIAAHTGADNVFQEAGRCGTMGRKRRWQCITTFPACRVPSLQTCTKYGVLLSLKDVLSLTEMETFIQKGVPQRWLMFYWIQA